MRTNDDHKLNLRKGYDLVRQAEDTPLYVDHAFGNEYLTVMTVLNRIKIEDTYVTKVVTE